MFWIGVKTHTKIDFVNVRPFIHTDLLGECYAFVKTIKFHLSLHPVSKRKYTSTLFISQVRLLQVQDQSCCLPSAPKHLHLYHDWPRNEFHKRSELKQFRCFLHSPIEKKPGALIKRSNGKRLDPSACQAFARLKSACNVLQGFVDKALRAHSSSSQNCVLKGTPIEILLNQNWCELITVYENFMLPDAAFSEVNSVNDVQIDRVL